MRAYYKICKSIHIYKYMYTRFYMMKNAAPAKISRKCAWSWISGSPKPRVFYDAIRVYVYTGVKCEINNELTTSTVGSVQPRNS